MLTLLKDSISLVNLADEQAGACLILAQHARLAAKKPEPATLVEAFYVREVLTLGILQSEPPQDQFERARAVTVCSRDNQISGSEVQELESRLRLLLENKGGTFHTYAWDWKRDPSKLIVIKWYVLFRN